MTCVSLPLNHEGRASGEAFVGLKNEEDVEAALAKNKELIQKRYIEGIDNYILVIFNLLL